MDIKVKRAFVNDWETYLLMINEWSDEKKDVLNIDNVKNYFCEVLIGHVLFICFIDSVPAGFIICMNGIKSWNGTKTLREDSVFIRQEYRRLGVASALMNKAKEYAIDNGIKTFIGIASSFGSNDIDSAKIFFEKNGFNCIGYLMMNSME